MKHCFITLVLLTVLNCAFSSNAALELSKYRKSSHRKSNQAPKKKTRPLNLDIPDTNIYFEGWVKYFHYSNDTHYKKPPSLFQNNQYYHQRIKREALGMRDGYGSLHIPTRASFFMVLYNNSLEFYTVRTPMLQVLNLVDTLKISHIKVIPEDDVLHGGVKDDGNFAFGYCIEIQANIPTAYTGKNKVIGGSPETWIICPSTADEKDTLLSTLIKLKVKHQRLENNGIRITTANKNMVSRPKPGMGSALAAAMNTGRDSPSGMGSLQDGYWVLLQDWTSCSKKCGNGTNYQQWMCVPPKNGGKPCLGSPLRTKQCNTHPCPSVNDLLALIAKSQKSSVSPKPIVQAGVFSNRPQRYSQCIVKENDAFMLIKVEGSEKLIRKPIRIMMNNQTTTIFNDDTYQEMFYSFPLKTTTFMKLTEHCCFQLKDHWRIAQICGYKEYCGPKDKNIWVDDWSNDYKMFKTNCKTDFHSTSTLGMVALEEGKLEEEMNKKAAEIMEEAQANAASEQAILVKKQVLQQAVRQYEKKKKSEENLSFSVLGKEISLENMVKKEEQTKEESETRMLEAKISQEEHKQECLEKSFEERELDDEITQASSENSEEIEAMHEQTRKKISQSRNKLKKAIQKMKLKAKTKHQSLTNKLKMLRSKMTKEIMLANKNGNIDTCRQGRKNADFRESYCNDNFVDDWTRNSDCKGEDFCYVCCENEFGAMYVVQRDNCYKMCDYKPKKKAVSQPIKNVFSGRNIRTDISTKKEQEDLSTLTPKKGQDDDGGKWVWAPKHETKH